MKVPRAARIENGTPLCQCTIVESCQPPANQSAGPLVFSHFRPCPNGSSQIVLALNTCVTWNSVRVRSISWRALSMNGSKRACAVPGEFESALLQV